MNSLNVRLFGMPQFEQNGQTIHIERRKAVALLAYLVLTAKAHSRDSLATMFWPEYDQSRARANLRRELSRLKADLGDNILVIERGQVSFNPSVEVNLDVGTFQDSLRKANLHGHTLRPGSASALCDDCQIALEQAAALYSGDFMAGFSLPDSPNFDDWQFFQSESLRQALGEALQHLVQWYSDRSMYERAVEYARRWLALDNLHEPVHRQLMQLYAWSGKHAAAIRQYQECVRLLREELGVEPEDETDALYERIRTKRLQPPANAEMHVPPPTTNESQAAHLRYEQQISYTTSPDGVRIAYSSIGEGPVLVKAANWLSHLEFDWNSPVWRHWLSGLSNGRTLVRYDERGCGLSDWDAEELSLDAFVCDLETIVDTLGLERFSLLGISQGGPVSIAYTVRHPEKVNHLILYGTYARGRFNRGYSKRELEMGETLLNMIQLGWGKDNPAFRQFFTSLFMPEATPEQMQWFNDLQKISTSPEVAFRLETTLFGLDVSDLVPQISVPTLVLHAQQDGMVPYTEGRWLAEHIPNSRFVSLDSKNHILLEDEPAWGVFLREVEDFLSQETPRIITPAAGSVDLCPPEGYLAREAGPAELMPAEGNSENLVEHNLPRMITPFVGRVQELQEIKRLILTERECRLLSIIGPGGMGKTRLAVEAAYTLVGQIPDGIVYVPLQSLNTFELMIPAICEALGLVPSRGESSKRQLIDYLSGRKLLLMLDNFEHLLDGADILPEIFSACPDVKIIVTSRQALNLQGEWLFPLDGLPYPLALDETDYEAYSSVQLFNERANRVRRDFSPADEWLGVVRICRLVEGLPLAIELAASWTRVLSTDQIALEIQRNLDFLATQLRDVPERHRSMQAVFDQSWNMLSREEQSAFKRLSVFRGSFILEAAQQIASASLPILTALVDKTLLRLDHNGRYLMQELLRQYAAERLSLTPDEAHRTHALHAAFYADYVHQRLPGLMGGDQQEKLEEIKLELENVRQAWTWSTEHAATAEMQKILQGLYAYYQYQSRYAEGLKIFEMAISRLESIPASVERDSLIAELQVCIGWLHVRLGQFDKAESAFKGARVFYTTNPYKITPPTGIATDPLVGLALVASLRGNYQAAIELGEQADHENRLKHDDRNRYFANYALTSAYLLVGEYDRANACAETAYELAKNYKDQWFLAYCLNEWGNIARVLGRFAEARQRFVESYTIRESFDDPEGMAVALSHLGHVAFLENELFEAKALFQHSLSIYKKLNDQGGLSTAISGLGRVASGLGDTRRAREHFAEALRISSQINFVPQMLDIIIDIAELSIRSGDRERGIELLSFVDGYPASDNETRRRSGSLLAEYAGQVSPDRFNVARQRGGRFDLEGVIAALLKEL